MTFMWFTTRIRATLPAWLNRRSKAARAYSGWRQRHVGPGIVPRLEVLEDRNLPSGWPTVTLSDGTVLQLVPASNDFSSFISGTPQAAYPGAADTQVALYYSVSLRDYGTLLTSAVYSNQMAQVTDSLPFYSWTATSSENVITITIASLSQSSVTISNGASIGLIVAFSAKPDIASVLWLSPVADGVRTPATSYSIAVQTVLSPNNVSQSFTIAGFDANGNLTGGYNSAIQTAAPPTNPLLLPSTDNGKMSFVLSTPSEGPRIPSSDNTGPCWGCVGYFPTIKSKGDPFVPSNAADIILALPGIEARISPAITNSTSLVLADTGLNMGLSLSIVQDSSLRYANPSAQFTWIGMRGPAEKPVDRRLNFGDRGLRIEDRGSDHGKREGHGDDSQSSILDSPSSIITSPLAHDRPMEAMVSEILSSLQQAKRDEKNDDVPSVALGGPAHLPSWNRDEETKGQVGLNWPFVLAGSQESNTKQDRKMVSLMVPLPVSRKDAELAELCLPLMTSLPVNDEGLDDLGIDDPLAAEVGPSRPPNAGPERVKDPKDAGRENQPHRTAQLGWIRWLESLGGFFLMVGGPLALWGNSRDWRQRPARSPATDYRDAARTG